MFNFEENDRDDPCYIIITWANVQIVRRTPAHYYNRNYAYRVVELYTLYGYFELVLFLRYVYYWPAAKYYRVVVRK